MAENEFQFLIPANFNYAEEMIKNTTIIEEGPMYTEEIPNTNNPTIIEEGPMICPVCSSVLVQYYVDFTTKFTMCPNAFCEYPFGENYTVYSSDDDESYIAYGLEFLRIPRRKRKDRSSKSKKSAGISSIGTSRGTSRGTSIGTSTLGTNSSLSTSEWSELTQTSHAYDSDDSSMTAKLFTKKSNQLMKTRVKKREDEQHIKQNVAMIKECNKMLFEGQEESGTIRNEKWIKNLSSMQSSSGMRLVKDHELQKLKKTQDNIQHGELKIDIASKEDAMSSIVIEIGDVSLLDKKQHKKT